MSDVKGVQEPQDMQSGTSTGLYPDPPAKWRMAVFSAIGAFAFFVSFEYNGKSSILLDHLVTIIRENIPSVVPWIIAGLAGVGFIRIFTTKQWTKGPLQIFFAIATAIGFVIAIMAASNTLPDFLAEEDLVPFLWNSIATPVGLIVPIGSIFLALLIGYGLLEFVGVFMQPIMRPVFRVPGRSAVDAIASFVASYSLGIMITGRVYDKGGYTGREAAIVATGFSTVSIAFMVIVANALDIMHMWGTYLLITFTVTFAVTAIVVRIPPISTIPDTYKEGVEPQPEKTYRGNRLHVAWNEAKAALSTTPSLLVNLRDNFFDGVKMAGNIVPSILSIGLGGLLIAKYTPIFDWIGYLFYPFFWLVRVPDPALAGQAAGLGIAEMFLPATAVADHDSLVLRLIIGVISVSAIIFFSALVPCILATNIPLSIGRMVILWFERVVFSILLATPLIHLLI